MGEIEYSEDFLKNLLSKKEYYKYKLEPPNEQTVGDNLNIEYLRIQSYQNFVKNLINPNTIYKRLLVKHGTGVGKTMTAIVTALEFVKLYRRQYNMLLLKYSMGRKPYNKLDEDTPSVFVIGFGGTKNAFIRDLINYPSLGIISQEEKDQLMTYKQIAKSKMIDDVKVYNEYFQMLKRKITNKRYGGFFKFYGYRELVNRIFLSADIDLLTIENNIMKNKSNKTLEEVIKELINAGKIKVNKTILEQFKNSIIICDESHNLYNSHMKNNYGVTIQFILDTVENIRALFLSATPINNSPSEIIDIINLLTSKDIKKKDYFTNRRNIDEKKIIELGKFLFGYVSFLEEMNITYYPKRIIEGEYVSGLPFLKFIPCKMSEFHQKTYNYFVKTKDQIEEESSLSDEEELMVEYTDDIRIPINAYSIYDIAFPNPDSEEHGLYITNEIKRKILNAPDKWAKYNNISVFGKQIIGKFLNVKNIGKYSTKYKKLIEDVISINAQGNKKIFIYHDRVMTTGVILIQELLKENNFIDEYSDPLPSTLCSICGRCLNAHRAKDNHKFIAARFILAHSGIHKYNMEASIDRYNSTENKNGHLFKILLGSRIIKESYELKDVQSLLIVSLPVNIPTLIQVFGRTIRKNSHQNLALNERAVYIRIYMHTTNPSYNTTGEEMSPETYRYCEKLSDYVVIQKIERELNSNAIDAEINKNIISTPDNVLNFSPKLKLPQNITISDTTFIAYNFNLEEIKFVQYMIKRLFIWQRVWTYEALFKAILEPPFDVDFNTKLIKEQELVIALNNLLYDNSDIKLFKETAHITSVYRLFDYSDSFIYLNNKRHKIQQVGHFYILFPVYNNKIIKDINSFISPINTKEGLKINIKEQIEQTEIKSNFEIKKNKILKSGITDIYAFFSNYTDDFYFCFLKEAIMYFIKEQICEKFKKSKYEALYEDMINLFDKFYMIIFIDELVKYKDVIKKFNNNEIIDNITYKIKIEPDTPIGFISKKSIFLYNNITWIEINKNALNKNKSYKENCTIIGFFEGDDQSNIKFKLRKSIDEIKSKYKNRDTVDSRLLSRGSTCNTKSKDELYKIAEALKIKNVYGERTQMLCYKIQKLLLDKEIKEREKDSNIKYVYLMHEIRPKITFK